MEGGAANGLPIAYIGISMLSDQIYRWLFVSLFVFFFPYKQDFWSFYGCGNFAELERIEMEIKVKKNPHL